MGRLCDALYTSSVTAIVYVYLKAFVGDGSFGGGGGCLRGVGGSGDEGGGGEKEHSHCKRVSWDVYVMLFIPRLLQI